MKKYLIIVLLLQITAYSFGQFSFGVKAGANVNELRVTKIPNYAKANLGFHVGLFAQVKISKSFYFIPEIQFSQRGFNEESGDRLTMNYFELPLLVSYKPITWLNIDLGPNFGYKVSGNVLTVDTKYDFGLTSGLRFNVSEKISIIARYYYGLIPIYTTYLRDDLNNDLGTSNTYHKTIQFGLSYRIK